VRTAAHDSRRGKLSECATVKEQSDHAALTSGSVLISLALDRMPTLDHDRARAEPPQRTRRRTHRDWPIDCDSGQRLGLWNIGRNDARQRQQHRSQRVLAGLVEQARAAARNEYGIYHWRGQFELADRFGDSAHDLVAAQRTGFERPAPDGA
jgi:hypothetical protein